MRRLHGRRAVSTVCDDGLLGGFITGVNAAQQGRERLVGGNGLSFDALKATLDKYCRDHPLDGVLLSSEAIYIELRNRQITR